MGLMNLDIMDDYGQVSYQKNQFEITVFFLLQGNLEVDAYLKEKAEMEMELMKVKIFCSFCNF